MKKTEHLVDRSKVFQLGNWVVEPASGTLRQKEEVVHLAPKVMDLLLILVRNQGEVVTKEELISSVWPDTFVAETALTRSISELRHSLAGGSDSVVYIETIPKRGYRLLVEASEYREESSSRSWKFFVAVGAAAVIFFLVLLILFGLFQSDMFTPSADHSLVVMPFDRSGVDSASTFLTVGVVEIVIESLSRIEGIDVSSGTSLTHFEPNTRDLRVIAEYMGIQSLLEGSFHEDLNGMTMDVRLLDTRSRDVLWSSNFGLDKGNTEDVASEITVQVASVLGKKLDTSEVHGDAGLSADNFEALQYRLTADYFRNKIPDSMEIAAEYYQKSIEQMPSYAPSYAGLAITYMGRDRWGENEDWASKAQEAVSRALALDKEIPESHIANGVFLRVYRKDFLASEIAFKEAIRLDPYHSNARREYALLLMRNLGRTNEALYQLTEATRLDPLLERNYIHLFELYCIRGEYDRAMETARRQFDLNPVNPLAERNIALAYFLMGGIEEAKSWAEKSVDLYDVSLKDLYYWRSFQLLALIYLAEGNHDQAETLSRRLEALSPGHSASLSLAGLTALYREDYPQAASFFRQALDLRPDGYIWPTGIRYSTYLAYALQGMGNKEEAQDALERSFRLNIENNLNSYEQNVWPPMIFQDELAVYCLKGEIDEAIKYLDGLVENGWKACVLVETNPLFKDAFRDPELQRLCEAVKIRNAEMLLRVEVERMTLR